MLHDSARLGAIGLPGIGFTTASCSAYSTMNGVITEGVSAGSNHVGASEMCTAQVTSPSGAATAGDAMRSSSRTNAAACSLTMSPPRDEAAEQRAVPESITVRDRRRAFADSLSDGFTGRHVEARHLALVANQRGDLPIDTVGDVDDHVRRVRTPVPELANLVRSEPFLGDLLGEVQMVAGERIDRVGRREPRLAVIAVLEVLDAIGIVHEHRVRSILPQRADDVAEELPRVLEEPVWIAEHDEVLHVHEVGGCALLFGALGRERRRRQRAFGGAGIAIG